MVAFMLAYTLAGELARHVNPVRVGVQNGTLDDGENGKMGTARKRSELALAEYERKTRVLTGPAQKGMPAFVAPIIMPDTENGVWFVEAAFK
ncbi:hypothetical protein MN608_08389 [Microdochium nivale]|nr:hypothetical protein MN608_08389 [Microdochium nivale]